MQFFIPEAFQCLWLVPAVIGLFWFSARLWEKRLAQIGMPETVRTKLMPAYRKGEWQRRAVYLALAVTLASMALARPQWGEEKKKIERRGVDILFMLDTSLSMLAEDVKPSRLEKSKLEIKTFIRRFKGDRVGLIAFAGSGFLQSPLTLDYSAFLLFLDGIKVGDIPDPGTSLDRALRLAAASFPGKEMKHKAVILFSDGEDHEGGIDTAIAEARKAGIRIYTLGTGTEQGEPIPLKDQEGRKTGFKKDRAGQVVITKLNQPLLERLASETGGIYLAASPSEREVEIILKHMEGLGKKQFKERLVAEQEDHFQFFLALALVCLVLEMLVRRTRKVGIQPLGIALAFFVFTGFLESPGKLNQKGNELFKEKRYQSAAEQYRKAMVRKPDAPVIRYNLATTQYQTQAYREAAQDLEKVIAEAKTPELKARAFYNFGNAQYRLGNFEQAIEAYQKALEINPKDVDAKYNLEFLQKEKSLFEKKNEERKKQQQQQQKREMQQQNQQQEQQQQSQSREQQDKQEQEQQEQEKQQQQQQEDKPQQDEQQMAPQDQGQEEKQPQPEDEKKSETVQQQKDAGKNEKEEEPEEQPKPASRAPLQGQMTLENALRILDALAESEKELQDLRRPPVPAEPAPVEKDW